MTEKMIEKMASALMETGWIGGRAAPNEEQHRYCATEMARVALQAIREPSGPALSVGLDAYEMRATPCSEYAIQKSFTAIIDAILEGKV